MHTALKEHFLTNHALVFVNYSEFELTNRWLKVELRPEDKGIQTSATRREMGRCIDYNGQYSDGVNYTKRD